MLQRDVFRLRHQPEGDTHKRQVQSGVEPEGARRTNRIQQRQEGRADNHVRHPVGGGGTGDTKIAAFERLDLRTQNPHHRRGTHCISGDTEHRHPNRHPRQAARRRTVIKLHQAVAEDQRTNRHHAKADFQRWFAPGFVHRKDGDKSGEHKGQADHQRGDHLLFRGGKTGHLKDARRVIHDDIHTGELLHRLQQHAEKDRAAHVAVVLEQLKAALLQLQAFANFIQLFTRFFRCIAQHAQHLFRFNMTPFLRQPARAVG